MCVSDDFGDFSNEPTSHQQPTQSNNPTPPSQNDSFGGGGGGGGGGLSLGAQFLSLCNETLGDQGGLGQERSENVLTRNLTFFSLTFGLMIPQNDTIV